MFLKPASSNVGRKCWVRIHHTSRERRSTVRRYRLTSHHEHTRSIPHLVCRYRAFLYSRSCASRIPVNFTVANRCVVPINTTYYFSCFSQPRHPCSPFCRDRRVRDSAPFWPFVSYMTVFVLSSSARAWLCVLSLARSQTRVWLFCRSPVRLTHCVTR